MTVIESADDLQLAHGHTKQNYTWLRFFLLVKSFDHIILTRLLACSHFADLLVLLPCSFRDSAQL